jgi:large-conductance mechanosensitive channel
MDDGMDCGLQENGVVSRVRSHQSMIANASTRGIHMDWVPIVFVVFKVLVFGTCMFFAIKWHYDQGKKKKEEAQRQAESAQRTDL